MTTPDPRLKPEKCALIMLAAGRSERFGISDKLAEPFLGHPLALHAVRALEAIPFAHRFAICGDTCPVNFGEHGFETVDNPRPSEGVSSSVRLGIKAAREAGAESVLIALADMPRVTAAQVLRLFDASTGADSVVASSDGCDPKPPALFGAAHFDFLERLEGDGGARPLIRAGQHVVTSPAELVDVDTEQDVAELRELYGKPTRREL
jgi:molybdenum cofactor cytidylyltransferase